MAMVGEETATHFKCEVDEQQKAVELPIYRICGSAKQNPHIRAFWGATISFFLAFFGWFAFSGIPSSVATSLQICENQAYPPHQFPKRLAYLKFKDLNTFVAYCKWGKNDANNPTDCKGPPASLASLPLCGSVAASNASNNSTASTSSNGTNLTSSSNCATAAQLSKYRPEILAACVCSAGTNCAVQLSNADAVGVSSTIIMRAGLGFLLERWGPVNVQTVLLLFGAIWVGASAAVKDVWSYIFVRFFIGMIGAAFVTNQFWNTMMFTPRLVGSANGISAGWGNLGGGVTTVFMPLALVTPFQAAGCSADMSWRLAMIFPAGLLFLTAIGLKLLCWDTPRARRFSPSVLGKSTPASVRDYLEVLKDVRVWIMMFQYGCCFGTELTMYAQLPRHFSQYFQMTQNEAAVISGVFGLTNIFSRPSGGLLSDLVGRRFGVRGRLWLQFMVLITEALLLFGLGCTDNTKPLSTLVSVVFFFAVSCEMACGTTFGIVPFMSRSQVAIVSAMVGAGGNMGAVISAKALYGAISDDLLPYLIHAGFVLFAAMLTLVLYWPEHGGMFCSARSTDIQESTKDVNVEKSAAVDSVIEQVPSDASTEEPTPAAGYTPELTTSV